MEVLDEFVDVLIENAFRFWKVDMACYRCAVDGGLDGIRHNHERGHSALSQESRSLTF